MPPRPRQSGQGGNSPAEKSARVGEFARAPVIDEHYNDVELRMQVNVLKAEVKTLTGAVESLSQEVSAMPSP